MRDAGAFQGLHPLFINVLMSFYEKAYTYMCVYTCTHVYTHTYTHRNRLIHINKHTYVCLQIWTHIYTQIRIYIHSHNQREITWHLRDTRQCRERGKQAIFPYPRRDVTVQYMPTENDHKLHFCLRGEEALCTLPGLRD